MLRRFAPDRMLAVFIVAGCLLSAAVAAAHARTRPRYGGTLRVEEYSDPLQPDGIAWRLVLDGLTRLDGQGNASPSLAVRWASENSDHRWQFWLRPGVSFQDSRPLNAIAVAASLEEACRAITCPWTAIHVSAQSVIFTGDNAMPNLPTLLSAGEFRIRQRAEIDSDGASLMVGTGPFRMKLANGGGVLLEANDDCWQGRPFVDTIEIVGRRGNRDSLRDEWMDLSRNKADLVEVGPNDIRQARQQQVRVVASPDVTLLALEINNTGLTPQLRAAIALAVDRSSLYQVIFQKQGEVTASLLPNSLSGYGFLFPTERDLPRALELRGGIAPPPLTLSVDGTGPMQLAAERLALNLHDAGFSVKVVPQPANANIALRTDLVLRTLRLGGGPPAAALEGILRGLGLNSPVLARDSAAAYKIEHDFLEQHVVIPLLYLPRGWAVGGRVRDLHLSADGIPDLADVSLPVSRDSGAGTNSSGVAP